MKKSMLLTTIAMIVVVVVALSTATFAWFSAQTTAAIDGTATIEATRDFIIRDWQSTKWESTDKINLAAEKVVPIAPLASLDEAIVLDTVNKKELVTIAGIDANATSYGYDAWFTTKEADTWTSDVFAAYTTAELKTVGTGTKAIAAVQTFQIAVADAASNASTVDIQLYINGQTADDLAALRAMNVVLHFQSYTSGVADQWVGTQYKVATKASYTTGNDVASVTKNDGVTINSTGLKADNSKSLTELESINAPQTNEEWLVAQKVGEGPEAGLYRNIHDTVNFAAGEYKLVTAYIWLDGFEAVDAMMAKAVTVSINFTKAA